MPGITIGLVALIVVTDLTNWPTDSFVGEPHIKDASVVAVASGPVTAKAFQKEIYCSIATLNPCAIEWASSTSKEDIRLHVNFDVLNDGYLSSIKGKENENVSQCISRQLAKWRLQPSIHGVKVKMSLTLSRPAVKPDQKLRCPPVLKTH